MGYNDGMASDAVDVVRGNSEAFSRMDVDGMLRFYAEDAVVVDRRRVSMGTFRGHPELRAYYLSIFHSTATLHETLDVVGRRGALVAAACELRGRLAGAPARAADVVVPYGLLIEVHDGQITHLELHESGENALAALEEHDG
jgi:ketosteroid isomerase-like protein